MVFRGSELHDLLKPSVWREYPLADSEVVYQGQPVAAVVSSKKQSLEDCLDCVRVSYEPLPVVSNPGTALTGKVKWLSTASSNLVFAQERKAGRPSDVVRRSPHKLELRFSLPRVSPYPMEGRGMVIERAPGETVVYSSTQSPHVLRQFLSRSLVEGGPVRVIQTAVGGAFGSKMFPYAEDLACYLVSARLRRNVKWIPFPGEKLVTLTHRPDQTHDVQVGYDGAGRILALKDDVLQDAGAYYGGSAGASLETPGMKVGHESTPIEQLVTMITGPYGVKDVKVRVRAVATNKMMMGPIRGSGYAVATFILERVLNVIAGRLGLDQFSVRRANLIRGGSVPYRSPLGLSIPELRFDDVLQAAAKSRATRDIIRRSSSDNGQVLRGFGISFYLAESAPPSAETVRLELTQDGKLRLFSSVAPSGQGSERTLAAMISRRLKVPKSDIELRLGDTATSPLGVGTTTSRSIVYAGSATLMACGVLERHLKERLGGSSQGRRASVSIGDDGVFRVRREGGAARRIRLEDVAEELGGDVSVEATYRSETSTFSLGCHVSLVEVDGSTGSIRVLRYLAFDDFGKVLDRSALAAQIEGGAMQSVGEALQESVEYDQEGRLDAQYPIPSVTAAPAFSFSPVHLTASQHLHGAKGAGEAGRIGSLPAIVNAVENALSASEKGIVVQSTPMDSDATWRLLRAKGADLAVTK